MTTRQGREQIYNLISEQGIEVTVIYKPLKKLLRQYGKTEVSAVLEELKARLTGSIEKGKGNPAFAAQIVVLESMLKWTDKKLNMNATKSI